MFRAVHSLATQQLLFWASCLHQSRWWQIAGIRREKLELASVVWRLPRLLQLLLPGQISLLRPSTSRLPPCSAESKRAGAMQNRHIWGGGCVALAVFGVGLGSQTLSRLYVLDRGCLSLFGYIHIFFSSSSHLPFSFFPPSSLSLSFPPFLFPSFLSLLGEQEKELIMPLQVASPKQAVLPHDLTWPEAGDVLASVGSVVLSRG